MVSYEPGQEPILMTFYVELPKDARSKYRDMERLDVAQIGEARNDTFVAQCSCGQRPLPSNRQRPPTIIDDDANYEVIHLRKVGGCDELLELVVGECCVCFGTKD